jgi:hypothetical protein
MTGAQGLSRRDPLAQPQRGANAPRLTPPGARRREPLAKTTSGFAVPGSVTPSLRP